MNTCHLCNPAHNEPFRSFVEGTTTYVCVPDGAECQLYADVDAPGQLKIESAGEEICSQPVDPSKRLFPLTGLLRFDLPWKPPASLLTSLVTRLSERMKRVTDFTVTITQRLSGPVAATYNFKLLNPADFEAALTASQASWTCSSYTSGGTRTSPIRSHAAYLISPPSKSCCTCLPRSAERTAPSPPNILRPFQGEGLWLAVI